MKEKIIEKSIINYLKTRWWLVESMQWGSVMIKKGSYNHRMTLNSKGCPDILYYENWMLYWIEVKKNQKEIDKWCKIRDRYFWLWKSLKWLKSYDREIWQIKYAQKLEDNWWEFIIVCCVDEIIEYFKILELNK